MANKKTVLVTGAGGFVGGRVVESLSLNDSANVRAGIKRWSSAARIARFPVEIVLCDIMDEEQIVEAMSGATHVIHCAVGDKDVIIQGTENLLDVAIRQKVERFVHLSTAAVYGNANGSIDETFSYQYTGNEYGDSKIDAEKLCWNFYEKGLPVVVLRPTIVYGPFSTTWTIKIAERLQSSNWGILTDHGEGICNLVYVDDLVSGILSSISHVSAVGEAFNINGSELITWNQYFRMFGEALGISDLNEIHPTISKLSSTVLEPVRTMASYLLNHFGDPIMDVYMKYGIAKILMKRAKKTLHTTPTLAELDLYNRDAHYLISKARDLLGYDPRFDVNTGVQMSFYWLEHHGFLPQHA